VGLIRSKAIHQKKPQEDFEKALQLEPQNGEIRRQLQELRDLQKEERKALSKAMIFWRLGFFWEPTKKSRNCKLVSWLRGSLL